MFCLKLYRCIIANLFFEFDEGSKEDMTRSHSSDL